MSLLRTFTVNDSIFLWKNLCCYDLHLCKILCCESFSWWLLSKMLELLTTNLLQWQKCKFWIMDLRTVYYFLAHKMYYRKRDIKYMCAVQQNSRRTQQLGDTWHKKFKIFLSFLKAVGIQFRKKLVLKSQTSNLEHQNYYYIPWWC